MQPLREAYVAKRKNLRNAIETAQATRSPRRIQHLPGEDHFPRQMEAGKASAPTQRIRKANIRAV